MIPFGPWRPDAALPNAPVCTEATGCVPIARGFGPLKTLVGATTALPTACVGAVVVLDENGTVLHFAGTASQLYKLGGTGVWSTNAPGGYAVPSGDQWKFTVFGANIIATNVVDGMLMSNAGAAFAAVAAAPKARYVTTVRDFVLLGGVATNQGRVQWSALGNATGWTPGTASSDFQDAQAGGPVRGLIGGETAYVLQAQRVMRMTFVPGSAEIFQFDEVESARGLLAPHSLVQLGRRAWYLAADGFYEFDTAAGAAQPIGVGKWAEFVAKDMRRGSEGATLGMVDPIAKRVVWVYVPASSSSTVPSRALIYDWSLQEATIADITAEVGLQWLTQGYTLDTINSFGNLDTLPFSLDSAFWRGGAALPGLFTTDHKLSLFEGPNAAAQLTTADGQTQARVLITGVRPQVNADGVTVAVAARERASDAVIFGSAEAIEDTGIAPAFATGNYVRARITVPVGATWDACTAGVETIARKHGRR